jgi:hypothetical protein
MKEHLRRGRVAVRTRQRLPAAIHAFLAQGQDLWAIAHHMNLGRNTVGRFGRVDSPEELLVTLARKVNQDAGRIRALPAQGLERGLHQR